MLQAELILYTCKIASNKNKMQTKSYLKIINKNQSSLVQMQGRERDGNRDILSKTNIIKCKKPTKQRVY